MKKKNYIADEKIYAYGIEFPKPPVTTIYIGKDIGAQIGVDKKFNWFQKKMIKWCFGFDIKDNAI